MDMESQREFGSWKRNPENRLTWSWQELGTSIFLSIVKRILTSVNVSMTCMAKNNNLLTCSLCLKILSMVMKRAKLSLIKLSKKLPPPTTK
jgi:hypothetical protein